MIYQKYNFIDSFYNASGNKRDGMVLGELGKIIKDHPEEVILAIQEADIELPINAQKKQIIKAVLDNKRNHQMIKNLSILIYANSVMDNEAELEFFGSNKDASSSTDKQGLFKGIGNWFAERKERRQQRKASKSDKDGFFKKVGGFVKNNQDEISTIGVSLFDSLQNRRTGETTISRNASVSQQILRDDSQNKAGFFEKNKTTIIVVGALVVVGYFAWKKYGK
jgi:hypothetical protein